MTRDALEPLADSDGFRAFAIVTGSGARFEIPHPEFIDIPPGEETPYIIVYRAGNKSAVPKFIDLDAIDHLDFEL
jgi:hypothetical protein